MNKLYDPLDIYLHGRNRKEGENDRAIWRVELPQFQTIKGMYLSIEHAEIPFVHYAVNEGNSYIRFQENGGPIHTVQIARQTASASNLGVAIAAAMNSAPGLTNTYICDVAANNRFRIYDSTPGATWRFHDVDHDAYDVMGYARNGGAWSLALEHTGEYPFNQTGTRYIDVLTNFGQRNWSDAGEVQIIARIPCTTSWSTIVYYRPFVFIPVYLETAGVHEIEIQLRDDNGNRFIMGDNHWVSIKLHIQPV